LIIRALVLTHQIRAKKAPAKINSTIPTAPHTNARDIDNVFMRDRPERNTETTAAPKTTHGTIRPEAVARKRSVLMVWAVTSGEVPMCLPERTSKVVLSAHQSSNAGVMPRIGTAMEKSSPTEACLRLESVASVMAIPNASKAATPRAKIRGVLKTDI